MVGSKGGSDAEWAVERAAARDLNSGAIHLLRAMGRVDAEAGLTPARLSALSVLVFGGPLPLGRLARIEGVTSPTMSRLVDALEGAGLAVRQEHPDSARMVLVSPTDEGRDLMLRAAERRADVIVAALRRSVCRGTAAAARGRAAPGAAGGRCRPSERRPHSSGSEYA